MQKQNNENNEKKVSQQIVPLKKITEKPTTVSGYFIYFISNSTPFFMIWVSLILMYGVICSYTNAMGQDEFYRFIFFLRSPVAIMINILALCAALIHTFSLFYSVFKELPTFGVNKLYSILTFVGLWIVMIGASIALLLVVLK